MKVLILEDEPGAAQNLLDLIHEVDEAIEVLAILESVKETVTWLGKHPAPDLGFFDIRLADGLSFEVFEKASVDFPVIFTTAYDEYALQAFKVNSIDYLLKPVDKAALRIALLKYRSIYQREDSFDSESVRRSIRDVRLHEDKRYKKSFLVYVKDQIIPVPVDQIAYFFLENELVYCRTYDNKKFILDQALDKIGSQLNPNDFYRSNRQYLVSRQAIQSVVQHFNRKLKLRLTPEPEEEVFISKTKATAFKGWLEM
jgi:DNA-binding LytR/AlgR family response regulator